MPLTACAVRGVLRYKVDCALILSYNNLYYLFRRIVMPKLIYLASPFFNEFELECVKRAEKILTDRGFELFSPRLHEVRENKDENLSLWAQKTFEMDRDNIDRADYMVMLYHGGYSDSGTAWECGYACGKGIPVIVVHIDEAADSNIMISESCNANISLDELKSYDFEALPKTAYKGKLF